MDVGPRPCWFDPGNSGKGFPAMSFSEPLAASIENTSTWLSTLSRAYRKLSGPSTASAVDGPDNFLYALDNVDNQVEVFSIDAASGSLKLIAGNPFPLFPGSNQQGLGPTSITVAH